MASSGGPLGIHHDAALQIIRLPLPPRQQSFDNDSSESIEMDFMTATSLNSENIQDYNFDDEVNAKNSSNWSPLMYAAYLGHRELCQLLILKGARVEEVNERSQTALMLAASCGAIDVVRILLDFSADFNRRDQYGRSSLHYAVKYYHVPVVQLLLERGADPNLPDYNDSTPVLAACENGDEKILSYLLEYKGDPGRRNKQGHDAFALVADEKLLPILRRYRPDIEPTLLEALHHLDLQKYTTNFSDHGIRTLDSLVQLTEKDLDEMGIGLLGPKRKLTNFIREMREKREQHRKVSTVGNSSPIATQQQPFPIPPATAVLVQQQQTTTTTNAQQQQQLQQRVDELSKLVMEQRKEMMEQKRVNAQCRQALTQIVTNGRCSLCAERTPRRGSIEELIRQLDKIGARLGSFLI